MKLDARDIKRFLTKTGLFSESELSSLVRRVDITHPLEQTTLVSFTLNDVQMGILFDEMAETTSEILDQVKHWGGHARLLTPKNSSNTHFMLESKVAYLITTKTTRQRLDQRLVSLFPDYSRSQLSSLVKQGKVKVAGQVIKKANYLLEDEEVTVDFPKKQAQNFPILREDDNFLAIDKPTGVLSHELNQIDNEWTVDDFVRHYTKTDTSERLIAHRLDRDTSGVILAGKNAESLHFLKQQFADRKVQKTYLALVSNKPKADHAIIKLPLKRSASTPGKQEVSANGRDAVTEYKVLGEKNGSYLLEIKPKTGRTHQIRVHLAHLGCPILGDRLYKGGAHPRLMLHAKQVSFTNMKGQKITIDSKTPSEFSL